MLPIPNISDELMRLIPGWVGGGVDQINPIGDAERGRIGRLYLIYGSGIGDVLIFLSSGKEK